MPQLERPRGIYLTWGDGYIHPDIALICTTLFGIKESDTTHAHWSDMRRSASILASTQSMATLAVNNGQLPVWVPEIRRLTSSYLRLETRVARHAGDEMTEEELAENRAAGYEAHPERDAPEWVHAWHQRVQQHQEQRVRIERLAVRRTRLIQQVLLHRPELTNLNRLNYDLCMSKTSARLHDLVRDASIYELANPLGNPFRLFDSFCVFATADEMRAFVTNFLVMARRITDPARVEDPPLRDLPRYPTAVAFLRRCLRIYDDAFVGRDCYSTYHPPPEGGVGAWTYAAFAALNNRQIALVLHFVCAEGHRRGMVWAFVRGTSRRSTRSPVRLLAGSADILRRIVTLVIPLLDH